MKPRDLIIFGLLVCAFAAAQTLVGIKQLGNVADPRNQFGFNCTTIAASTVCEIDRAYMLHLLPIPFNGTATPPSPGACSDSGGVIVTNEPAAYFCAPSPGGALNWIRVAGVATW